MYALKTGCQKQVSYFPSKHVFTNVFKPYDNNIRSTADLLEDLSGIICFCYKLLIQRASLKHTKRYLGK